MPAKWDHESELKLAMAVIKSMNTKPKSWEEVASLMGESVTIEGCRQHFQKMLKTITFDAAPASATASGSTSASTPVKSSASIKIPKLSPTQTSTKAKPAAAKRKKKVVEEEDDSDDEGGVDLRLKKIREEDGEYVDN
ncbi:hypothetical protein MMC18_000051 [Xylographa bjoerkii]|nr:hypothetical protein [Xylographa bjoerkii]